MLTVKQISEHINGTIVGDENLAISGVGRLENGKTGSISFLSQAKYIKFFENSNASAVIVSKNFDQDSYGKTLIKVENPSLGFAQTLELFDTRKTETVGIHPTANIAKNAKLGDNLRISQFAVIEDSAEIGDNSSIGAGSFIGNNTTIGKNTTIHPNVTIYDQSIIGDNVTIDSGTVIGADGFGWVTDKGKHNKIPQIGRVVIHNNVWIGANCCIDRGTFQNTTIGEHTKLDNLIQIAHNVQIGKSCLLAALVGIAGSTTIGDFVTLAGQVGVVGHISIGDRCVVASKSAVMKSIEPGSFISGIPARNHLARRKQDVVTFQLPELLKRVRELETKLKLLEKG
ncbi:MAG: UDP-3-O-(3-hydroxymyristoyl)glucosamine N-acyltransferase [Candidatus Marinimicrobia bacterium]|nr:UDP-3-O-(3-hydroxymyristoyl)glucosamine N-acyltransferase [Candidatus Neomarinimicrobiota bacterium]MBL7023385.1 UDP-3-O-(3-hydroxymyristoyl)glucosamine N-acyltransferase [Candidatus Neomarinimicrobiota bacterium]MBL7109734.1 UDP-3-O-(3-hydroxymyristoyl)glucosamine N-acyltransferase [Candidatus Neomarinimicrobiota bacterium]